MGPSRLFLMGDKARLLAPVICYCEQQTLLSRTELCICFFPWDCVLGLLCSFITRVEVECSCIHLSSKSRVCSNIFSQNPQMNLRVQALFTFTCSSKPFRYLLKSHLQYLLAYSQLKIIKEQMAIMWAVPLKPCSCQFMKKFIGDVLEKCLPCYGYPQISLVYGYPQIVIGVFSICICICICDIT